MIKILTLLWGGGGNQKKYLGRMENLRSVGKQKTNIILILALAMNTKGCMAAEMLMKALKIINGQIQLIKLILYNNR